MFPGSLILTIRAFIGSAVIHESITKPISNAQQNLGCACQLKGLEVPEKQRSEITFKRKVIS